MRTSLWPNAFASVVWPVTINCRDRKDYVPLGVLHDEVASLETFLAGLGLSQGLCHNDFHYHNILINEQTGILSKSVVVDINNPQRSPVMESNLAQQGVNVNLSRGRHRFPHRHLPFWWTSCCPSLVITTDCRCHTPDFNKIDFIICQLVPNHLTAAMLEVLFWYFASRSELY